MARERWDTPEYRRAKALEAQRGKPPAQNSAYAPNSASMQAHRRHVAGENARLQARRDAANAEPPPRSTAAPAKPTQPAMRLSDGSSTITYTPPGA